MDGGIRRRGNVLLDAAGQTFPTAPRSRQTMMSSAMRPPPLASFFSLYASSPEGTFHPTPSYTILPNNTFYPPGLFFIMLSPLILLHWSPFTPIFWPQPRPFGKSAMSGWPNGTFWGGKCRDASFFSKAAGKMSSSD